MEFLKSRYLCELGTAGFIDARNSIIDGGKILGASFVSGRPRPTLAIAKKQKQPAQNAYYSYCVKVKRPAFFSLFIG